MGIQIGIINIGDSEGQKGGREVSDEKLLTQKAQMSPLYSIAM